MAKYSTGGAGGGDGDACELCGAATDDLARATVAGAELLVCPDCRPHGETSPAAEAASEGTTGGSDGPSRRQRAAQNAAKANNIWDGDSERWEREGADYDDDPLPYLVSGYGDRAREARQDAGYQLEELAAELDVPEDDLLAIEQGRAARAGVGGSTIEAVEAALDVTLAEEA